MRVARGYICDKLWSCVSQRELDDEVEGKMMMKRREKKKERKRRRRRTRGGRKRKKEEGES